MKEKSHEKPMEDSTLTTQLDIPSLPKQIQACNTWCKINPIKSFRENDLPPNQAALKINLHNILLGREKKCG